VADPQRFDHDSLVLFSPEQVDQRGHAALAGSFLNLLVVFFDLVAGKIGNGFL
jgi:hypothetical protein